MEKSIQYILKLREKPEDVRRQILAGSLTVCMVLVVGIWVYSIGSRFSISEVAVQAKADVKPLTLFTGELKNVYSGLTASAANSNTTVVSTPAQDKVIDLIPVEQQ
jgi:hypothetical protein